MRIPRPIFFAALAWSLLFLAGGVFYPLGALVTRSVSSSDGGAFQKVLFDPEILSIVSLTLKQALLSTGFSCVIGFGLGLFTKGRVAQTLLALPFGIPTVIVALVLTKWLGQAGILAGWGVDPGWAYSLQAVILAHVLLNAPWIALWVSHGRSQIPVDQLEMARTLGATSWQRLSVIEWPYLRWSLASSAVQVFTLCVMSFALVLILGGGPPVQTLETEIYSRIRLGSLDLQGAMACAIWELGLTLLPWGLLLWMQKRRLEPLQSDFSIVKEVGRRSVLSVLLAGLFLLPYGMLFAPSEVAQVVSAFSDAEFISDLSPAVVLSLKLALCVAMLTVFTAVAALLLGEKSQWLSTLPAGVSILVLGLGFWLAYGQWIDPFEGSFAAILLLQTTLAFPVAYRSLWPTALGTQKLKLEAALTLGADPLRAFFLVEWHRWRTPLFKVFAISMGASLGEVAAVSLFYSEELIPVPLLITRWMGQYRFEQAQALAMLLLLLCLGSMTAIVQGASQVLSRKENSC